MNALPDIIPLTDLRKETKSVLKRLQDSGQPIVITQRGRATAVMLDIEAYERLIEKQEILYLLARGEREIAQGKGHSLDDVLADADRLLNE